MVVDPRERAMGLVVFALVPPLRGNFLTYPTPAAHAGKLTQFNSFLGLALRWPLNSHQISHVFVVSFQSNNNELMLFDRLGPDSSTSSNAQF